MMRIQHVDPAWNWPDLRQKQGWFPLRDILREVPGEFPLRDFLKMSDEDRFRRAGVREYRHLHYADIEVFTRYVDRLARPLERAS